MAVSNAFETFLSLTQPSFRCIKTPLMSIQLLVTPKTAFRDKKSKFAAKTRSRDLGYRRFLWMMDNLLYNS